MEKKRKRKGQCALHNLTPRHKFSTEEARFFMAHAEELRLCNSCFQYFSDLIERRGRFLGAASTPVIANDGLPFGSPRQNGEGGRELP